MTYAGFFPPLRVENSATIYPNSHAVEYTTAPSFAHPSLEYLLYSGEFYQSYMDLGADTPISPNTFFNTIWVALISA